MGKDYNFIIALVGKSSCGKDSVARVLASQHGYKYVVSTTTRPMRSNDVNHVDYHFVSDEEFQQLINEDKLVEYRYYDTIQQGENTRWHYGIEKDEIDLDKHSYVAVVDLQGLSDLENAFGNRVISIYIDVPEEIRRIRAIARDRNFEEAEFDRRCKDDDIKFEDVSMIVDVTVRNIDFHECVSKVLFYINHSRELVKFYTQYCSY